MSDHPQQSHSRTQFQIDRIAFFSDAVIAIALTLMILEIKIPELGSMITLREILREHGWDMVVHLLALFVAFWTIGNLWMRHHKLFENIVNYNDRMIRINLYFLFTVMLLPISISFLFTKNEPYLLKMLFYFGNLFLSSSAYSLLIWNVFNPKNQFSNLSDPTKVREIKQNSLTGSLVFLMAFILILLAFNWFWLAFLILPLSKLIERSRKKSLNAKQKPAIERPHT